MNTCGRKSEFTPERGKGKFEPDDQEHAGVIFHNGNAQFLNIHSENANGWVH